MATTLSLLNLSDTNSVAITAIETATKANFAVVDTVVKENGSRETLYQKVVGDEEYPMTVRVGYYKNLTQNGGIGRTSISVKLETFLQKADADDVIWTLPASTVLAINMPGGSGVPSTTDVTELIGNTLSWLLPVSASVITSDALDELKFGITNGLLAYENSTA